VEGTEKIKILYVDDEKNNLIGFKASFRIDYIIYVADNTTDALNFLDKHPDIRIVFCDQRMPDKTGVQFFEDIRTSHPNPIRILLTGYTDIEAVIEAINLGNVFRYIKKPWQEEDIRSAINEGNKFYIANSLIAIKNESLQKAYDELDKFAYSVTHDMRGPLLSLIGAIDLAQDIDDVSSIKEMLQMMRESVHNLDEFIQNIHDYYNVNRGQLQIKDIDFNTIVEEQLNTYNLTAKMNHVTFNTTVSQNKPFRSDPMSMKIILNNLLSNAFKYQKKNNPDKKVELDITVENETAVITVKDNGIGIASSHIGDIFNMFFRGTSQEVGSGFGLYNVKDALLKLNGEIKVDSVLDEGTIFKIILRNK
jgi:two-component system sensor histidine kinase/response regulator